MFVRATARQRQLVTEDDGRLVRLRHATEVHQEGGVEGIPHFVVRQTHAAPTRLKSRTNEPPTAAATETEVRDQREAPEEIGQPQSLGHGATLSAAE